MTCQGHRAATLRLLLSLSIVGLLGGCIAEVGGEEEDSDLPGVDESQADDRMIFSSSLRAGIEARVVNTGGVGLRLRSGPGLDHTILTVMPEGARIALTGGSSSEWYRGIYSGRDGWCYGAYLAPVADASGDGDVRLLDPTVVSRIVEPEGSGKDDAGASYTDRNYWNFCSPGAAAAALYYFKPTNVTAWPAGHFKEPRHAPSTIPAGGTYWKSDEKVDGYHTYGRAYVMYLAMKVKPPNYITPGMLPFDGYPTSGTSQGDLRDALNWEASGHAAGWSTFHYKLVGAGSATAAKLHSDIVSDIKGGHAVVAGVDTIHLPNWSRSLKHSIAVIGYDDVKKTYAFVDTCGVRCNGSSKAKNGGIWAISQAALLTAVKAAGLGYIR